MDQDRAYDAVFEKSVLDRDFENAVLDDIEPIPFRPHSQDVTSHQATVLSDPIEEPIDPVPLHGIAPSHFHSHFAPLHLDSYEMFDHCEGCGSNPT